ncbi:MAG: tRNA (adenosine(37)-N6)-threonylcarbamoyltransferase complex dimerization subunit type 1 TsaB [Candidatus Cryptobacteroides sp.]
MITIPLIETSTALCSAALMRDGKIISYRESREPKAHASLTAVFIREILEETGTDIKDCDAVCVSMGPGSYTGLRVGVSTAKGLCFGAGIPLIAVGTLDTLASQAAMYAENPAEAAMDGVVLPEGIEWKYVVPMVDARRMEVYTAVFRPDGTRIGEVESKIIDGESFADILSEGPVLFIGDGAGKCRETICSPNAYFAQCNPKASAMTKPAMKACTAGSIRDTAYFEPFYLKEFTATVSRKKLF